MPGKLIVGILNIRSSFRQDVDARARGAEADTVQWWVENGVAWRIRTFAMDGDVHVDFIGVDFVGGESTGALIAHIERNYGEFLSEIRVVEFRGRQNPARRREMLDRAGLGAGFVRVPQGFSYWNPAIA